MSKSSRHKGLQIITPNSWSMKRYLCNAWKQILPTSEVPTMWRFWRVLSRGSAWLAELVSALVGCRSRRCDPFTSASRSIWESVWINMLKYPEMEAGDGRGEQEALGRRELQRTCEILLLLLAGCCVLVWYDSKFTCLWQKWSCFLSEVVVSGCRHPQLCLSLSTQQLSCEGRPWGLIVKSLWRSSYGEGTFRL